MPQCSVLYSAQNTKIFIVLLSISYFCTSHRLFSLLLPRKLPTQTNSYSSFETHFRPHFCGEAFSNKTALPNPGSSALLGHPSTAHVCLSQRPRPSTVQFPIYVSVRSIGMRITPRRKLNLPYTYDTFTVKQAPLSTHFLCSSMALRTLKY